MADLLQRFSGNPFSTPVGQKIEQATDVLLNDEDWALNMEVCDYINETDDGARDAVRAIKKRLQQSAGKNYRVFNLTLTVLETCVKNCGKRFHVLVTSKDFVQELVKLIGPKNDPPAAVQERVLSLIQSWAEAFHGQPDCQGVSSVYNELRSKGFDFPRSPNEPKVPIHTPERHLSASIDVADAPGRLSSSPPQQQQQASLSRSPQQRQYQFETSLPEAASPAPEMHPIHLSPEQLNKLRSELEIVQGNIKVFSEMLTELKPGQEHRDDLELLVDLNTTCQEMQKRIVDLIEKVTNEEVTSELLRLNDELNNLFIRHERYQKKKAHASPDTIDNTMGPSTSSGLSKSSAMPAANAIPSLIDFGDEPESSLSSNLQNLHVSQSQNSTTQETASGDHDFDMFAQLRSQPQSSSGTTQSQPEGPMLLGPVASQTNVSANNSKSSGDEDPSTNVNFEQFLQRRANALEQQPIKKATTYNQDSSLI